MIDSLVFLNISTAILFMLYIAFNAPKKFLVKKRRQERFRRNVKID